MCLVTSMPRLNSPHAHASYLKMWRFTTPKSPDQVHYLRLPYHYWFRVTGAMSSALSVAFHACYQTFTQNSLEISQEQECIQRPSHHNLSKTPILRLASQGRFRDLSSPCVSASNVKPNTCDSSWLAGCILARQPSTNRSRRPRLPA